MRKPLWHRVKGINDGATPRLSELDLDRAIRASKPSAPPLDSAAADRMLDAALAAVRTPRSKPAYGMPALGFAVALAAVAGIVVTSRQPVAPGPADGIGIGAKVKTPANVLAGLPIAAGRESPAGTSLRKMGQPARSVVSGDLKPQHGRSRPVGRRPGRRLNTEPGSSEAQVNPSVLLASRKVDARRHAADELLPASDDVGKSILRWTVNSWAPPDPASEGHLVVAVSEPRPSAVVVDVSRRENDQSGLARASAYASIGPGGGVLTQCTLHRSAEADDFHSVEYGFVQGEPIVRLPFSDDERTADANRSEKEILP